MMHVLGLILILLSFIHFQDGCAQKMDDELCEICEMQPIEQSGGEKKKEDILTCDPTTKTSCK